jgi:uncharacterized membrane protein YqjE
MDPAAGMVLLTVLSVIFLAAVYWTLFKIRGDLAESQKQIRAELSEIRKLLESKTNKA